MAEDREILREVWDGRVPVCVQLASEDCSTLSAPDPYYLMVPRLSYLPLVMEKVFIEVHEISLYRLWYSTSISFYICFPQ